MLKRKVINKEAHNSCILTINTVYNLFLFSHVQQTGENTSHVELLSLAYDSW